MRFLDAAIISAAVAAVAAYVLYTLSPDVIMKTHAESLYLTSIFVSLGVFRYLKVVFIDRKGGSPTDIVIRDRFIQLCVVGWLVVFGIMIY